MVDRTSAFSALVGRSMERGNRFLIAAVERDPFGRRLPRANVLRTFPGLSAWLHNINHRRTR